MSDTIHDYLEEYGDISFAERPLNDVDSLALCELIYLKFDGMVPGVKEDKPFVRLQELAIHPDKDKLFADERFEKDNRRLFEGMLQGKRFADIKLNCYIDVVEKEREAQFAAVTFLLDDGTIYVAFRGTDESIVGWKEDFNMAFLTALPSHSLSVKYLNMVTSRFSNDFYLGGHSKGGNLAIYSAMNCVPYVQKRIRKIYSLDGPGLHPQILEKCDYERIADKVVKIKPQSSIVGMLFEWDTRYQVVESRYFGLLQHNLFNWKVEKGEFIVAEDIYERARQNSIVFNEWIMSQDEEHIRLFVDTLYKVISASEAEDVMAITADWKNSMLSMIAALKEVDEETTQILQRTIKELFELGRVKRRQRLFKSFRKAYHALTGRLKH